MLGMFPTDARVVRYALQLVCISAFGLAAYEAACAVLHTLSITSIEGAEANPAKSIVEACIFSASVNHLIFAIRCYVQLRHKPDAPPVMSCIREERAKVKKLAGTRAFWMLHAATPGMWPAFWLGGNPDVYRTTPRQGLLALWRVMQTFYGLNGAFFFVCGIALYTSGDEASRRLHALPLILCGACGALCIGLTQPRHRRAIHAFLGRLGGKEEEVSSAAMATLVGGVGLTEALQLGKARFRAISFGKPLKLERRHCARHWPLQTSADS